jgi:Flp pilus assembly protein TadB
LSRSVGPPSSQWTRWWASHQARGRSQPGKTQPPSRTARAVRWAGWTTRVVRPTSRGWVGAPPRTGGSRAAAGPQPGGQVLVAAGLAVVAGMVLVAGMVVAAGVAVTVVVVVGRVLVAVVVGGLAGDQDPGQRPIAGQPLAGLGT